ncbi:hypothetical protein KY285_001485 [Solanum tuberosum]|nr:hypothetical protein KY289_001769 [Solanum tuberosum]KAH0765614.1 hypothetical protein KY285_001485 [Solanum tuberosum]
MRLHKPTRKEQINVRSKSRVNKKNAEGWIYHKKGHFERDFPMSKSKEKGSASIVEQATILMMNMY